MTKYSHLSYDERVSIEDGLNNNQSISKITKDLKRNHSTILREIDRNKIYSKSTYGNPSKTIYLDYSFNCEKLNKKPYVCNGCPSRRGCRKHRYTYYAKESLNFSLFDKKYNLPSLNNNLILINYHENFYVDNTARCFNRSSSKIYKF